MTDWGRRRGGRPQRDLEDAARGMDADPVEQAAANAYATSVGRTRRTPSGDVFTVSDLGALPDTVLDDYEEDYR